jgi:hypothetical protein
VKTAFREVSMREKETLEARYLRYQWKEGDEAFVPAEGKNHIVYTTLPSFVGKYTH